MQIINPPFVQPIKQNPDFWKVYGTIKVRYDKFYIHKSKYLEMNGTHSTALRAENSFTPHNKVTLVIACQQKSFSNYVHDSDSPITMHEE